MNTDETGRIVEFEEKPEHPKSNLASMGIYIFNWKLLRKTLLADMKNADSSHDFGKDIIPALLNDEKKLCAYKYKGYWKDVGTIDSLWEANMDLLDKNEYRFVWVTEFPLLEWSEEENRFTAMHHPFTMLMEEDLPLLDTDPGKVRAKAYDIVLNGNEIGGGSVRIHQDDIQERMFEALGFTKEAAHEQFGFLLDAFKYGVPPHAGLAYGLDRLVMLMAKVDSIRDVIAFPKVKDASCLMTQSPSRVSEEQLKELELEVRPEEVTE